MQSSEQLLECAARDGSLDIAEWPRVLESLLQRLHDIVYNEFPIPSLPHPTSQAPTIDPQVVASTPPQVPNSDTDTKEHDLPDAEDERPPDSQSSTKENDAPTEVAAGRPPSVPTQPIHSTGQTQQTGNLQLTESRNVDAPPNTLPPDLLSLYQMSRRVLEHDFPKSPPYTIQRLAELVLRPKAHYRYLPAYLRALDRIVSVSSPLSNFPLATTQSPTTAGFLTNGVVPSTNGISEREGLGSDESLGGALLTPIPWLRNNGNVLVPSSNPNLTSDGELHSESTETIEGPNGAGHIETVSVTVNGVSSATTTSSAPSSTYTSSSPIASPTLSEQSDASSSSASSTEAQLREQGGVTQGELLRQEQEAGLIPVNPPGLSMGPRRTMIAGGAAAVGREQVPLPASNVVPSTATGVPVPMDVGMDDEQPHARGPDVIGMEDMGPQRQTVDAGGSAVLDMEAAVGRGRSKSPQPAAVSLGAMGEADSEATGEDMEGVESGAAAVEDSKQTKQVEELNEVAEQSNEEIREDKKTKDGDGDLKLGDADEVKGGGEDAKEGESTET
ncbi:unnamed protein product [Zymoseptoria tritici ST99CH_1A5]|uniref:Protein phosphatase 4 core regulatory subunit R2 n=3 Tax=Zymoseptoria tritici TaxID=1047171 RepID=A0A1X7RDL9_ZYMT9|nr:unnamed protein product [Zymoseptoria tritici ST99CH_3D7]SMR41869.1 unnamed protein product [Zymoseptoria tritici ST99CH_1E4]SMY19214.1 unnamed protein product [Zymoseptoria tritici ST99CH_1A5]